MNPQVRTGLTHFGTAMGGAIAAISFASSHSVDLYAIMDQINVVVKDVTQLIALVMPIATAAYGIYRTTLKARLTDLEKPGSGVEGVVVSDPKLAATLGAKIQTSAAALPKDAQ